jgi:hypothetical protein
MKHPFFKLSSKADEVSRRLLNVFPIDQFPEALPEPGEGLYAATL